MNYKKNVISLWKHWKAVYEGVTHNLCAFKTTTLYEPLTFEFKQVTDTYEFLKEVILEQNFSFSHLSGVIASRVETCYLLPGCSLSQDMKRHLTEKLTTAAAPDGRLVSVALPAFHVSALSDFHQGRLRPGWLSLSLCLEEEGLVESHLDCSHLKSNKKYFC